MFGGSSISLLNCINFCRREVYAQEIMTLPSTPPKHTDHMYRHLPSNIVLFCKVSESKTELNKE
jgi:hypothetical protein